MLQKELRILFAYALLIPCLVFLSRTAAASTNLGVVVWGAPGSGGDFLQVASRLGGNVKSIYPNDEAFAAIKVDGEILTWGDVRSGGDSSAVASQLRSDVSTIFSTLWSFAALKTHGEVVTWGQPDCGGDSSEVASQLGSDVSTIFSNQFSFAALKTGGEVVTWGSLEAGGDSSEVASQLRSDVSTIFGNQHSYAAIKTGGEVVTWGMPMEGGDSSEVASQLRSDVSTIFSNECSFAALKTPGEVVTWGEPSYGGDSSEVASQLRSDVSTIFSNDWSYAAIKTGGKVVTWGMPEEGGDSSEVASQLRSDVSTISSTFWSFAALKTGGEVITWGDPQDGGDASEVASQLRSDVSTIFSNGWSFVAMKAGGEVVTWGYPYLGGNSSAVASQFGSDVITIVANEHSFAALKRTGKVVSWGDRFRGGGSQQISNKLNSRVQSIVSSGQAFAALVCVPHGKMASTSNCMPCRPSEIWKDMECQECEKLWEVPNGDQSECEKCGAGSVPNLPHRTACEPCPVFQKPSGSSFNTSCEIDIATVVVAAASVLLAILLSCPLCCQWLRIRRRHVIQHAIAKTRNRDKIHKSFKSIHTLDFPMVVLRAEKFLEMQCLTSHEAALLENLLVFLHTIADVGEFVSQHNKIIFFSHQWLSFRQPDPDNIHYNCMVQALHSITDRRGWRLSDVYVWVDYTSIPQACSYTQKGAISSLPIYASWASAFVILAPNAPHKDLRCECNLHTYSRRTWCRVECLAHYCHCGLEDMLVSSAAGFEKVTEDWLQDVLLIFEADCTCCRLKHKDMQACDKELLVTPVLAMYMRVLLDKHHSKSSRQVYNVIETLKDRMFPKTLTGEFTLDSEKLMRRSLDEASIIHGIHSLRSDAVTPNEEECIEEEERELFGSLLDDLKVELPTLELKHQSMVQQPSQIGHTYL